VTREPIELGNWVSIFTVENGAYHQVREDQFDEIDAAYGNWVERRIDKLLHLTTVEGGDCLIAASRISEVVRSTPTTRELMRRFAEQSKREEGFNQND